MAYRHLALAAKDMRATHEFYEGVMGFELVKVEIAPLITGGWGKHFFYRMDDDDSSFIAFWELHDGVDADDYIFDLNQAARLPPMTNHYAFAVADADELSTESASERRGNPRTDLHHLHLHDACRYEPGAKARI